MQNPANRSVNNTLLTPIIVLESATIFHMQMLQRRAEVFVFERAVAIIQLCHRTSMNMFLSLIFPHAE